MTATTLFYVLIIILCINFLIDQILDRLNSKHFDDEIPKELVDVYNEKEYKKLMQSIMIKT